MKTLIPFLLLVTLLTSCDVYMVEPRYDYRDRFVGSYELEEFSNTYKDYTYYSIRITKDSYDRNDVFINNFYAANLRVRAYVEYDRITIPQQIVNGFEVEGTGSVNNSRLLLTYRVKNLFKNTYTDFCEADGYRD